MLIRYSLSALAATALLVLANDDAKNNSRDDAGKQCQVRLTLQDESGGGVSGMVRVTDADGNPLRPSGLLSRGLGLDEDLPIANWYVLSGPATVELPQSRLKLEAVSGIETEAARFDVDLTGRAAQAVTIRIPAFADLRADGYRSANTHLHLQKISREQADRYLREVPAADRLDGLFLSYLERAGADREYVSNRYTRDDLEELTQQSNVLFGNGEEHRHNFTGFGEGYGHVMLLDINELVLPVSIGPGIMKTGTDGTPLQRGIDAARRDEATVIWCHNRWGLEAPANFVTGRVHALNIFDGGVHGSFKDSFYRFLNAGLRVPFSTGTDWFMYDFSRVYVRCREPFTIENWLDGLAAGRSFITNGPLLELSIDGLQPGDTVKTTTPRRVEVRGTAAGRIDFERIELIQNGRVVHRADSTTAGGHFEATLSFDLNLDKPCWLALRTPPPPVKDDPDLQTPVPQNEFGRDLFAHTSPVYVEVGGRPHFDEDTARELLAEMTASIKTIADRGNFADEQERQRVLDVYHDGIARLRQKLAGR